MLTVPEIPELLDYKEMPLRGAGFKAKKTVFFRSPFFVLYSYSSLLTGFSMDSFSNLKFANSFFI